MASLGLKEETSHYTPISFDGIFSIVQDVILLGEKILLQAHQFSVIFSQCDLLHLEHIRFFAATLLNARENSIRRFYFIQKHKPVVFDSLTID